MALPTQSPTLPPPLAADTMLPNLADADTPRQDVQLFTLTLRPASKNLVVDVAAYQAGEGGR